MSTLPWTTCNNTWNTPTCYVRTFTAEVNTNISDVKITSNLTDIPDDRQLTIQSSSEEFWEHRVLGLTESLNDLGVPRWELVLCSLGVWTVVFLTLSKGIKSSGKFMVCASTLPYLVLGTLLVRTLLLPGAVDGIKYFFIPRWKDLLKISVWSDAAVQVFFSTSLGLGESLTLGSHNRFNNNCHKDAIILPFIDAFTSIFAGCVIFATLGYTAAASDVEIDFVVKQGPGISFIVYPDALATLPVPQLWSVLFFLVLFLVGVSSEVVGIQVIIGGIFDTYPKLVTIRKTVVMIICIAGFLSSLVYFTEGGMYVLQLVDWYLARLPRMAVILAEVVAIAYLYGKVNLYDI